MVKKNVFLFFVLASIRLYVYGIDIVNISGDLKKDISFDIDSYYEYCISTEGQYSNGYIAKGSKVKIRHFPVNATSRFNGNDSNASHHFYTYVVVNGTRSDETEIIIDKETKIDLVCKHEWSAGGQNNFVTSGSREVCVVNTITLKLDEINPSNPKISNPNSEKWTNGNVIITVEDSSDSESGLKGYEYSLDKINWVPVEDDALMFDAEEKTTLYFRSVDKVGNVSDAVTTTVLIDKRAPIAFAKNEKNEVIAESQWYRGILSIKAIDSESGVESIKVDGEAITEIKTTGKHKVSVRDCVGNTKEYEYWVDLKDPEISGIFGDNKEYDWGWTNQDVTVNVTDEHSGIKEFIVAGCNEIGAKKISGTGKYTVIAEDNVGNRISKTVQIDQKNPISEWQENTFKDFEYKRLEEGNFLNSFSVNYVVTEDDSGIFNNVLKCNNVNVTESQEKNVSYKEYLGDLIRNIDEKLSYSVAVTDKANNSATEIIKDVFIPRKIEIRIVEKEEETSEIIRTRLTPDGYTTVGILMNKIDFSLYKNIKIKRTFFKNIEVGFETKQDIDYKIYKDYFDDSVEETYILGLWNDLQDGKITEKDVKAVKIGDQEFWYYEDKIKTVSGMGHKGIRYQAEWEWLSMKVIENGLYTEIEKTANSPGNIKIRIEGTNEKGSEKRYTVLDKDGNKIEQESDRDFHVPIDGVVKLAVKIEDNDFDLYSVEAMEYVSADFINEVTGRTEKQLISVAMKGSQTKGYIQKNKVGSTIVSEFRKENYCENGWYEFDVPEIKLYFNKPYNMRIVMIEGYGKNNDIYQDVTSSGMIMLKAEAPDLGGFKLSVGENVGYNYDGITARPYQKVMLDIEANKTDGNINEITWNYGDGTILLDEEKEKDGHAYRQSPERTGNTSEYTLTINLKQNNIKKTASLKVYIVDTQYGVLLGDETWIGKHPILNKVQVGYGNKLRIVNNWKDETNPTVVLGIGSVVEANKGAIEIFEGGKLEIEGSEESKILITEGRNDKEFCEVEIGKIGTEGGSLKWKGITLKSGSEAYINNAEIKFAQTGIEVINAKKVTVENTIIKDCSISGMKINGTLSGKNLDIKDCEDGLSVQTRSNATVTGYLEITDVKDGIICDGNIMAEQIILSGILETGREGLQIRELADVKAKNLTVSGFTRGVLVKGNLVVEEKIVAENCKEYGVNNSGYVEGNQILVKDILGRGYIAGNGSLTEFMKSDISAGEIGIHCVGNVKANFGMGNITGGIYGIKTDRNSFGLPVLKLEEKSQITGKVVKWYDWNEGVLKDDEIEIKKSK